MRLHNDEWLRETGNTRSVSTALRRRRRSGRQCLVRDLHVREYREVWRAGHPGTCDAESPAEVIELRPITATYTFIYMFTIFANH